MIFLGPSNYMDDVSDLYSVLSPDINYGYFENAENILYEHVKNNDLPFEIGKNIKYLFVKHDGVFDFKGKKFCELTELI